MKKFRKMGPLLLTGTLAIAGIAGATTPTFAKEKGGNQVVSSQEINNDEATVEYYNYIKVELRKNKVSESDIKKLMKKLKNGEVWDSINPKMKDTPTETKIDKNTTKYTFPDGSVSIQTISGGIKEEVSKPEGGMTTKGTIGGGTHTSGSGYHTVTGARVSGSVILAGASYKIDYTFIQGGYDKISRVYSRNITVPGPGGNYEVESWGVKKATETVGGKAYAVLRFKASNDKLGATTFYLNTYVGKDKATVSSNM
ncbi:hypothetical protein ACWGJQ_22485 [Peribacillus simplex]